MTTISSTTSARDVSFSSAARMSAVFAVAVEIPSMSLIRGFFFNGCNNPLCLNYSTTLIPPVVVQIFERVASTYTTETVFQLAYKSRKVTSSVEQHFNTANGPIRKRTLNTSNRRCEKVGERNRNIIDLKIIKFTGKNHKL